MQQLNLKQMGIGFVVGLIIPFGVGTLIATLLGIHADTFIRSIITLKHVYNTPFQLGVAGNIGLFFWLMKYDKMIFFNRGLLISTMLVAILAMVIELRSF
jgi:hypothetical protein